jgi:hypothetical protein
MVGGGRALAGVLAGWMLHERNDSVCHKPRRAYRFPGTGDLDDLDDAPTGCDLDATTGAGGDDLIRQRAVVCGDNDLDAIALHGASVARR